MTASLSIVILAVDDVARARDFYTGLFGWTVRVDAGVFVQLSLRGGPDVGLYQRAGFAVNTGLPAARSGTDETTAAELYLSVDGDLDGWVDRMVAAGATLLSKPQRRGWGDVVAYFRDPDGHVVALATS